MRFFLFYGLLLLCARSGLAADVSSILRSAMVNDIQKGEFDLEALHRAFPDAAKSALDQRVTVRSPGPGALLDIAFGGESHSKQQQVLQEWLFGRCARLPISGGDKGLRQECTKRVATFAAVPLRAFIARDRC